MSSKGYELVQLAKSLVVDANGTITDLDIDTTNIEELVNIDLAIAPEVLEIQVAAPAAGQATTWLWTWEQSTLPYARRTITNSPELSVPLYLQGTYTVNNYAAYDIFDQMTQTHSLYLKWIDGAGTDNLISWATSTGPVSDTHPDINGGNATDVQRISISVPNSITLPTLTAPSVSYTVVNNGSGAYTFSGSASGDNPNIGPFYRGGTYTINITATGHPFYFTTDNGTNFSSGTYFGEYTDGVTGSRTDSGTITFTVPNDAPDTLYYQCGNHSAMRGAITIKDLAVETNINGNYVVYFQHTQEGHKTPVELRPIPSLVNQMCIVYDASVGKFVPQDLATYVENTPSFENKIREVAGTAELVVEDGSAVVAKVNVYADSTYLPLVGNNAGDQAFATDTNKLYIWDGSAWQLAGAANTGELPEGTNLYYTDARVDARLASGNVGDLVVGGDLTVNGTTTTINSATLTVDDKNIVLASGATDSITADGAGITIDGANATLTWNDGQSTLDFNKPVSLRGSSADRYTGLHIVNTTSAGGTESAIQFSVVDPSNNACDVRLVAERIGANAGSDFYIESTDSNNDIVRRLTIAESGNVGIGTDSPIVPLQVQGDGFNAGGNTYLVSASIQDNTNYRGVYLGYESDEQRGWVLGAGTNSNLSLGTYTSGNSINQALNIDANGNVGIGTDNPLYKLIVSNNGAEGLEIGSGYAGGRNLVQHYNRSTSAYVRADNYASQHNLYANTTEIAEVNSDGIDLKTGSYKSAQVRHSIRPTLNLDFANSKQLDPRITFYRDSIATYYDSKGVLRYANSNEPRFDHDPVTGKSKGLLIEEARTNYVTFNPTNYTTVGSNAPLKFNVEMSPNGKFDAHLITGSGQDTRHSLHLGQQGYPLNSEMALSIYVKPYGNHRYVSLESASYSNWTTVGTRRFDLVTKTALDPDSKLEEVGNGWIRLTMLGTVTNGNVSARGFYLNLTDDSYTTSSADIPLTDGCYFWNPQAEIGSFATSPIPIDTRFTSRSSVATYHDETGILRTAPDNSPRYGYKYDGRKWVETGLILESAATNLVLNSTMNSTYNWSPSAATIIIGDYGLNPDNSQGSTMFVRTNQAGGGKHIRQTFTIQQAEDYTISVYAKLPSGGSNAYDFLYLRLYDVTNTTSFQAWFNIDTGTIGTVQNAHSANIEDVGNGWYRCSVSGKTTTSSNTGTMLYDLFVAETDGLEPNPGDNSSGLLMWGAQLETGFAATSFIYTNTSNVTRSADVASSVAYTRQDDIAQITGNNFNSFYNQDEGTTYIEAYPGASSEPQYAPTTFAYWDGVSTDDRINMRFAGTFEAGTLELQGAVESNDSGLNSFYNPTTTVTGTRGTLFKGAISMSDNNFIATSQGDTNVGTLTTLQMPYVKQLTIGSSFSNSYQLNGHVKKLSYYDQQLTSAELQALTENN